MFRKSKGQKSQISQACLFLLTKIQIAVERKSLTIECKIDMLEVKSSLDDSNKGGLPK